MKKVEINYLLEDIKKFSPEQRLEWIVDKIKELEKQVKILKKPLSERIDTNEALRLVKLFCKLYYNYIQSKYFPSWNVDVKRMKNVIRNYGIVKTEILLNLFFYTANDPSWWHYDKLTISVFSTGEVLQKLYEYAEKLKRK